MKKNLVFNIVSILVFLLALLPAGETPVQAQAPEVEITRDTLYVPGEVVVGFDRDLPKADMEARAEALAGSVGAMVVDQYADMALLSVDPEVDVVSLSERLAGQAGVAYAEPNYISWIPEADPLGISLQLSEVSRSLNGDDTITRSVEDLKAMRSVINGGVKPTYPDDEFENWGNSKIEHDIIWVNNNPSPVVCVIDTGVDDRHPDMKGKVIKGYDFVNGDNIPNDDNGHGTHVSGTIAAVAGNGIGPAGISNGKVLAVKALSAQGWGTDFDIAAAINYCALNSSVRVINMSLGGYGVKVAQYIALDYAINTKGKLVVASAGNDSVSTFNYPAGWAKSGSVGPGLISVAALRMPSYDYIWVDVNGDNVYQTSTERYYTKNCATDFTNYGAWVEMIAPGESIYSTLPVSYPFWNNYINNSAPGYDYWDGTSMAAPHVAAAAARVWSINPNESNFWVHNQLLNQGYLPVIAQDPTMPNVANGYNDPEYGYIDSTTIKAPFCWPTSMSSARLLSVAAAMERGAFVVRLNDAATGLPMVGATVTVKHEMTAKTLSTAKMTSMTSQYLELINIPADGLYHRMYVNMKGFTAGNQLFSRGNTDAGGYHELKYFYVGVPPKKGTSVVAVWKNGYNLDLFAFLPAGAPSGVVGSGKSGNGVDTGQGTLLDYPRARWFRDGGGADPIGVEAITLFNYPGVTYPYYLGQYPNGSYEFLLHDYNNGSDLNTATPILRIWNSGKIIGNYFPKMDTCSSGETWWGKVTITRSGTLPEYSLSDQCGTGTTGAGGVWPYAEGSTILSVNSD